MRIWVVVSVRETCSLSALCSVHQHGPEREIKLRVVAWRGRHCGVLAARGQMAGWVLTPLEMFDCVRDRTDISLVPSPLGVQGRAHSGHTQHSRSQLSGSILEPRRRAGSPRGYAAAAHR